MSFDAERDELTLEQRREIAETLSTRAVSFDLESLASVTMTGEMRPRVRILRRYQRITNETATLN